MTRRSPEAIAETQYRRGWDAARALGGDDFRDLIDSLDDGRFCWSAWFDGKPSANYLAGFTDSAWRWWKERGV